MTSGQRIMGKIWVTGTTLLIAFIAYSVQIFVIYPWYGGEISVDLIKLLGPFKNPKETYSKPKSSPDNLAIVVLVKLINLLELTTVGNANAVSLGWVLAVLAGMALVLIFFGILDHHCPWVDNCVGHYNYSHFIRFLFYVDISCLYHLSMLTNRVFGVYRAAYDGYWVEPSNKELVYIILNYVTCLPVLLIVGGFSAYHFYCLFTNTTTIEAWEKDKVATLIRRGKIREVKFPYNLGWKENFYSVCGRSPLYWWIPTKVAGDGLTFKVAGDEDEMAHNTWPPEDPYAYEESSQPAQFDPDSSPWTYGDGMNPDLQPSNAFKRSQARRSRVPPYHPDYNQSGHSDHEIGRVSSIPSRQSSVEDENEVDWRGPRLRRGSEGWEVGEIDREELLRRYISSRAAEPGRYQRYVSETDSEVGDGEPSASILDSQLETTRV